jgi:hypothetical protein
MKTALGTFAALLCAGTLYAHCANAQQAPQGLYLNSCTHVGMDRDRLIADCRRADGRWQRTVLDVDRCVGDIANVNGHLSCKPGAREGYGSSRSEDWRAGDREDLSDAQRCALLAYYGPGRAGTLLVGPLTQTYSDGLNTKSPSIRRRRCTRRLRHNSRAPNRATQPSRRSLPGCPCAGTAPGRESVRRAAASYPLSQAS